MNIIDNEMIHSAYMLALKGYNNEHIAHKLGFSLRSLYRYINKSIAFSNALREGRKLYNKYSLMKFCSDNNVDYSFFEKDYSVLIAECDYMDNSDKYEKVTVVEMIKGVETTTTTFRPILPSVDDVMENAMDYI